MYCVELTPATYWILAWLKKRQQYFFKKNGRNQSPISTEYETLLIGSTYRQDEPDQLLNTFS